MADQSLPHERDLAVLPEFCACCNEPYADRGPDDLWQGRLHAYCEDCASARCDAFPGECEKKRGAFRSCVTIGCEGIRATHLVTCEGRGAHPYCDACTETLVGPGGERILQACNHDQTRLTYSVCPVCAENFYPAPEPGESPYVSLYMARGQMKVIRDAVAKAADGLADSNPKVRALKRIDKALAGQEF